MMKSMCSENLFLNILRNNRAVRKFFELAAASLSAQVVKFFSLKPCKTCILLRFVFGKLIFPNMSNMVKNEIYEKLGYEAESFCLSC